VKRRDQPLLLLLAVTGLLIYGASICIPVSLNRIAVRWGYLHWPSCALIGKPISEASRVEVSSFVPITDTAYQPSLEGPIVGLADHFASFKSALRRIEGAKFSREENHSHIPIANEVFTTTPLLPIANCREVLSDQQLSKSGYILCRIIRVVLRVNNIIHKSIPIWPESNFAGSQSIPCIIEAHNGTLRDGKLFFAGLRNVSSEVSHPEGQSGIHEDQHGGYLRPKKYLIAVGCALVLGGFVLVSKVLDKVYLDPRFNVNMAVGGFCIAMILFLAGGWIVFAVLGFMV
jgi:hypothetical protein